MKRFDHHSGETLEVDGAKIYYETAGASDGPALLLLHGGFGTIEDFNVILPRLSPSFRVIGIDSRGHGRSTLGAAPLTYERIQDDVVRIIEHLNLADIGIVGFSDGGIVGYRLAAQPSLRITKLVTIGAASELKEDDPKREIYHKITADSWRDKFPETYTTYQKLNPEPNFDLLAGALVKMWLDTSPSGYPGKMVDAISCKTLIVRGDDDHLFARQEGVEIAGRIKGAKFSNLVFAGHVAFQDQTEVFMHAVNKFLEE